MFLTIKALLYRRDKIREMSQQIYLMQAYKAKEYTHLPARMKLTTYTIANTNEIYSHIITL
jgi:hypothetical protein